MSHIDTRISTPVSSRKLSASDQKKLNEALEKFDKKVGKEEKKYLKEATESKRDYEKDLKKLTARREDDDRKRKDDDDDDDNRKRPIDLQNRLKNRMDKLAKEYRKEVKEAYEDLNKILKRLGLPLKEIPKPILLPGQEPEPLPLPPSPPPVAFDENVLNQNLRDLALSNMIFIVKAKNGKDQVELSNDPRSGSLLPNSTATPVTGHFLPINVKLTGNQKQYYHFGGLAGNSNIDGTEAGDLDISTYSTGHTIRLGAGKDRVSFVANTFGQPLASTVYTGAGDNEIIVHHSFNVNVIGEGNDTVVIEGSSSADWKAEPNQTGGITLVHKDGGKLNITGSIKQIKFKK